MNFNNHIPIYLQIIDLIKRDIVLGIRKPGDKLESVREYALNLKVNPNTVQKAYQEMERMDLAFSKRGIGRFIIEKDHLVNDLMNEMSSNLMEEFVKKMHDLGYTNNEILVKLESILVGG